MLQIKRYTISELEQFINSPQYNAMPIVPISRHRAKSYLQNPRVKPSHVVLYLAFSHDEMVGYRTLLPDTVMASNGVEQVAWLSGSWVKPSLRREGIATLLFYEALKDWEGKLLYTNYAPEAKAVLDKTENFNLVYSLVGKRFYLRPCLLPILGKRGGLFRWLKPVWWLMDKLLRLLNPLPWLAKCIKVRGMQWEYLSLPDDELAHLFEESTAQSAIQRKRQELEWILSYPWLVSSPLGDKIGERYFFSSAPKQFIQSLVKFKQNNRTVGFALINVTDGVVSVPYAHCPGGNYDALARFILKHSMAVGATRLTIFHPQLVEALKKRSPFGWFSKKQLRNYFATHSVNLPNPHFIEGDGDCVFV